MNTSTLFNLVMIVLVVWFIYTRIMPTKGLRNLNDKDFEKELNTQENKILIDVREPHEYKSGHLPSAKNIPLSQLGHRFQEIPKDRNIYLYCRSGMRSKQAARLLSKKGYSNMAHLQGGILAWSGKVKIE